MTSSCRKVDTMPTRCRQEDVLRIPGDALPRVARHHLLMTGRVAVVGAGVVGLSCAVRLAEAGIEVNVLARDLPLETTSAAGGGLWLPHPCDPPDDVVRWARATSAELVRLADEKEPRNGSGGVRVLPGTLLQRFRPAPEPAWSHPLADVVQLTPVHQPAPGHAFGHRLIVPVVHMPKYLEYLVQRLVTASGTLTRFPLAALPTRGIVVNCTGTAARALACDPTVRPVRRQIVLLADPGLGEWWYDNDPEHLAYVLPRGTDVVVGGGALDDCWDTTPDEATARRLVRQAVELVPALSGAPVLGHRVGLHPVRPSVRLEVERHPTPDDPDHVRVHCYGHGGSGLTLSWGCAEDVAHLVADLLPETAPARVPPSG
jgi:D-amino-acid oxidase